MGTLLCVAGFASKQHVCLAAWPKREPAVETIVCEKKLARQVCRLVLQASFTLLLLQCKAAQTHTRSMILSIEYLLDCP